jgi:hypothetical protein
LWPVAVAVAAAGLQLSVATRLALHPRWLLPVLVLGLLIVLAAVMPAKVRQGSATVQVAGVLLVIIAAFASAFSAVKRVQELLQGRAAPG